MDDSYNKHKFKGSGFAWPKRRKLALCLLLTVFSMSFGGEWAKGSVQAWERTTLQIPWAQDEIGKLVAAGVWPRELMAKSPDTPLTQGELAQILSRVLTVTSALKSLTGQVRAVDSTQGLIQVATGGEIKAMRVSREAIIYREGQPATLAALRPISNDDFQEIYAILNPWGELAYIEGFYVGAEVIIQRFDPVARTITVSLPAQKNAGQTLALSKDLRVIAGGSAAALELLHTGHRAFVVLDIDGMVKKIVQ